jgi:hypothetical protein
MMDTPDAIDQPHFIVDTTADESVRDRLHVLERRINEKPALFQSELKGLGELAIAGTINYSDTDERQVTLTRSAKEMISEFFTQRLDLEVSFDETTESALLADKKHSELLDDVTSKRAELIKTGIMSSNNRPNEKAIPAREKLRRYRLEFYIGRVLASQPQPRTNGDTLRSTG